MYQVRAVRWTHGWELHIDGRRATQSHTLADAEGMVRDFLTLDDAPDAATAQIVITPDLGGLEDEAREAAERADRAADAQRAAAVQARAVASKLRNAGLSVADTAVVMGVSRARVSRLTRR